MSDGLFSPKSRHVAGGGGDRKEVWEKGEGGDLGVPGDELLLCHVIIYSSFTSLLSPPRLQCHVSSLLLSSHPAAAPSWAAGGGNLCLSHCSDCAHTELRAGGLLLNNTGFTPQTAQPHPRAHTYRNTAQTRKQKLLLALLCSTRWVKCTFLPACFLPSIIPPLTPQPLLLRA